MIARSYTRMSVIKVEAGIENNETNETKIVFLWRTNKKVEQQQKHWQFDGRFTFDYVFFLFLVRFTLLRLNRTKKSKTSFVFSN